MFQKTPCHLHKGLASFLALLYLGTRVPLYNAFDFYHNVNSVASPVTACIALNLSEFRQMTCFVRGSMIRCVVGVNIAQIFGFCWLALLTLHYLFE